jgi:hypothetical protein
LQMSSSGRRGMYRSLPRVRALGSDHGRLVYEPLGRRTREHAVAKWLGTLVPISCLALSKARASFLALAFSAVCSRPQASRDDQLAGPKGSLICA